MTIMNPSNRPRNLNIGVQDGLASSRYAPSSAALLAVPPTPSTGGSANSGESASTDGTGKENITIGYLPSPKMSDTKISGTAMQVQTPEGPHQDLVDAHQEASKNPNGQQPENAAVITRLTPQSLAQIPSSIPRLPATAPSDTTVTETPWLSSNTYQRLRHPPGLPPPAADSASELTWDTRSHASTIPSRDPNASFRKQPYTPPRGVQEFFTLASYPLTTTSSLPHALVPLPHLAALITYANTHLTLHPPAPSTPPPPFPFPRKHTVILENIPGSVTLNDLVHSIYAPGGLRLLRFAPHPRTAVAVFFSARSALEYTAYAAQHGFFLSQRATKHHAPRRGETKIGLQIGSCGEEGGVKKVWVLKKHAPQVVVRAAGEGDAELLAGVGAPNDAYREGSGVTRTLRIRKPWTEVEAEMKGCRPADGREWAVDHVGYFPGPDGAEVTMMRFFGVGDAVALQKYLKLRGEEAGEFVRDVCDKECEALAWDGLVRCQDAGYDGGGPWRRRGEVAGTEEDEGSLGGSAEEHAR